jgi:pSer/pThr/pTyr-binding forkhead associated (FHA) protein
LYVTAGLIAGKQFILYRNPTFVGSSPRCEIYLFKDPDISPQHAAIHSFPGGFELEDLGSATGTRVNGRRVRRTRLRNNDLVQIGSTCFLFREKARAASGEQHPAAAGPASPAVPQGRATA